MDQQVERFDHVHGPVTPARLDAMTLPGMFVGHAEDPDRLFFTLMLLISFLPKHMRSLSMPELAEAIPSDEL